MGLNKFYPLDILMIILFIRVPSRSFAVSIPCFMRRYLARVLASLSNKLLRIGREMK